MVWLTLLSALAVVAFATVLVVYLVAILRALDAIGGRPTSFLAKIRLGVRAIESETGALAPQVTRLNDSATAIRDGLGAVAKDLDAVAQALGGRR